MAFPERTLAVLLLSCLATIPPGPSVAAEVDPIALAAEVATVGPRRPGTPAQQWAVTILLRAMRQAGLEDVAAHPTSDRSGPLWLEGRLPGPSGLETVLTAHLDTVEGSPGAADDAAGCAVVVAAAGQLASTPRRHGLRVVLFGGEEDGQVGAHGWVASLDDAAKGGILAVVNLDLIGWDAAARGALLPLPADVGGHSRVAPGWLVSVALAASRAVGPSIAVAASPSGVSAQVLARSLNLRLASDAEPLLAAGLPAITLSDVDLFRGDPENHRPGDVAERLSDVALDRWVDRVGALAQRLDTMTGRPRDDDQWLAVLGRVWSRRSLYWIGLTVWAVQVFQGLREMRRRNRHGRQDFLPGFAVRFLFLGCVLMLPVHAVVLLVPAALVLCVPRRWPVAPRWKLAVASLPMLLSLVSLWRLTRAARVESLALGLPAAALIATTFGAVLWLLASENPEGATVASSQTDRASSPRVDTADSHSSTEL